MIRCCCSPPCAPFRRRLCAEQMRGAPTLLSLSINSLRPVSVDSRRIIIIIDMSPPSSFLPPSVVFQNPSKRGDTAHQRIKRVQDLGYVVLLPTTKPTWRERWKVLTAGRHFRETWRTSHAIGICPPPNSHSLCVTLQKYINPLNTGAPTGHTDDVSFLLGRGEVGNVMSVCYR